MSYDQVFESYDDLKTAIADATGAHTVLPYADPGVGAFGYRVLDEDSGYGKSVAIPGSAEEASANAAASAKSKLFVWLMFGRELSPSTINVSTVAELNAYLSSHPGSRGWQLPGSKDKVVVDYTEAVAGKSVLVRLSASAWESSPDDDRVNSRPLYPGFLWPVLFDLEPGLKTHSSRRP